MMRILYIEDDALLQKSVARGLKNRLEAVVTCVARPGDAITALQLDTFDIVVSDYNIIDGTGGQVLDWVRANKPEQRFMFLSDDDRITTAGVPFVRKPAPMTEVCAAIQDALK